MNQRTAHWIPENRQERIPPRMVTFDTESKFIQEGDIGVQTFRTASAIRWRTGLKSGDYAEGSAFNDPYDLWRWVSDYCRRGERTVVWAHNLGYDVRIAQIFKILPELGWNLEWCNLDRNVSAMTWRSERGTLVFADTWTWVPMPLNVIAPMTGLVKFNMPKDAASEDSWQNYCMRDTEIVYRVVSDLIKFIRREHLGNWQPTGAGMAYATWRHRFMQHKILVHDDTQALQMERKAMHTGRAEAWRHGKLGVELWTEVDMRNAYLMIGAECDLPRKLRNHYGRLSLAQYSKLASNNRVLARVSVDTDRPCVPVRVDGRTCWPVGTFETTLWDTEIDCAVKYGASITIQEAYVYASDPILRDWAQWVLSVLHTDDPDGNSVAQTWIKHCSRALIGRLSLRVPSWEKFGSNPEGITGISRMLDVDANYVHRLMHVGEQTLIETEVTEGRDSLPQVTGWIMAECRRRLWEAMNAAGLDHVAHVDTDSVLVDGAGLRSMQQRWGADFQKYWGIKGTYRHLEVIGPRCYFRDGRRVASGIPVKAELQPDGSYKGERWTALAGDLEHHGGGLVTTRAGTWHLRRQDPRRDDSPGAGTATVAVRLDQGSRVKPSGTCSVTPGS